jgi:hypothetical protein
MAVTFTTHAHRLNACLAERLRGIVHFIRVSMDGLSATYESLRGKSFSAFLSHLEVIRRLAPFGINYIVNRSTLADLNSAVDLASKLGATELLLLPEQPVRGIGGIDIETTQALRIWIKNYHGPIPLAISEAGSDNSSIYVKTTNEEGLLAYAHIDATGLLKRSSYDQEGVLIGPKGLIETMRSLEARDEERGK